jgi:methionine-rich copper-binding protein CopC
MRLLPALAVAGLIGALASPAFAHPKMTASSPLANAVVASPSVISLTFNENLTAALSGIDLKDAAGKPVAVRVITKTPPSPTMVSVQPAAPLRAGVYTVDWHAVASDGHRITGKFSFTVR